MGQAANPKPKRRDEWDDDPGKDVPMQDEPKTKRQTAAAEPPRTGALATTTCYIDGFKYKQVCLTIFATQNLNSPPKKHVLIIYSI
jgi:hypothetical protein